jgi:small-conductance mechanosensitive channel
VTEVLEIVINSLEELLGSAIKSLPNLVSALAVLFLTKYAVTFVQPIVEKASKKTLRSVSLQILLKKSIHVSIWVIGVLLASVIAFPDLELGDIVATLGLGSVAVGFAFQDIFKNFLAGIILLVEEPFRIGDEVVIDDYNGTVVNISIRTTQIRTPNGEKILLPNSKVFTDAVKVMTAYNSRRSDLKVGVDYQTSLTEAKSILKTTIQNVDGVLSKPIPEIDLVNFSDHSIDFVLRYWTLPQQKEVRYVQTQAIIAIKQALDAADIMIPYPIHTIYYGDREANNSTDVAESTIG